MRGRRDHHAWVASPIYKQFDLDAPAETVIKIFMPPPSQNMMQVQRPLPKSHQEWLRGFNDARQESIDERRQD